jgi:hypothetical protein
MPEQTAAKKFKPCRATIGPDDEDATIYMCNRKQPHRNLHMELDKEGYPIASWCSCRECRQFLEDIA